MSFFVDAPKDRRSAVPSARASRSGRRSLGCGAGNYDSGLMIAVMWQFDVKQGREREFELLYGVEGDWTALNRRTRSYLGSSFLHDQNRPTRYVLIEYWSEMLVYEQHRESRLAAIESLEQRRAELVEAMEPLGIYTALDVPDRSGPTWSSRRG